MSTASVVPESSPTGAGTVSSLTALLQSRAAALGFTLDEAQLAVVTHLERIESDLKRRAERQRGWRSLFASRERPRGLYLWGGVGRGKSFMMDGFFEFSASPGKRRVHFHRFMREIHASLRDLQGQSDPLPRVAAAVAAETRLLCLDEFQVMDIGDAMILGNLLAALVEEGVTVITTSNTPPGRLYEHGLQRDNFMPAIRLLESEFEVVKMDRGVDYRQVTLERAGTWHVPPGPEADRALADMFLHIAGEAGKPATQTIEGRAIEARASVGGVAWFDFDALCDGPRAQADYIELARRHHTVFLSGLPKFDARGQADRIRRFTWLIDEFYDRRVKLIVSAEGDPAALYSAVSVTPEQERTMSRLIEMQTHRYLGEPHQG